MFRTTTTFTRAAAFVIVLGLAACGGTDDTTEMEGMEEMEAAPEAEQQTTAPATDGMLNPNDATRDDLLTVPNIDETLADALAQARPYDNMLGVDQVLAGQLSEEQRDSVYTRLWMPIDLNNASAEEILLIPGVGPRMQHEFEEYRPYTAIEQFRREIGKYVDEDEVGRLERYVEIR